MVTKSKMSLCEKHHFPKLIIAPLHWFLQEDSLKKWTLAYLILSNFSEVPNLVLKSIFSVTKLMQNPSKTRLLQSAKTAFFRSIYYEKSIVTCRVYNTPGPRYNSKPPSLRNNFQNRQKYTVNIVFKSRIPIKPGFEGFWGFLTCFWDFGWL